MLNKINAEDDEMMALGYSFQCGRAQHSGCKKVDCVCGCHSEKNRIAALEQAKADAERERDYWKKAAVSLDHAESQQRAKAQRYREALESIGRCIRCKGDGSPQCVTCDDYQICNCKPGYGRFADKCWACDGTGISNTVARAALAEAAETGA